MIASVDEAAARAGMDRLEWIRRAARGRLEDDTTGVELEFDEDDVAD